MGSHDALNKRHGSGNGCSILNLKGGLRLTFWHVDKMEIKQSQTHIPSSDKINQPSRHLLWCWSSYTLGMKVAWMWTVGAGVPWTCQTRAGRPVKTKNTGSCRTTHSQVCEIWPSLGRLQKTSLFQTHLRKCFNDIRMRSDTCLRSLSFALQCYQFYFQLSCSRMSTCVRVCESSKSHGHLCPWRLLELVTVPV